MLRFIVGRAGSGKSHRILKEMSAAYDKKKTDNLILLIPEQYSLEASADFMEKMGQEGHIHLDVLSFKRLAHRVFEETGATDRVQISELGKTMLLRRIFEKHGKDLKVYGRMAGRSGFMESFNSLIAEMKRAQVTEADMERQLEGLEDSLLRRKLEDITTLYKAFNEQMDQAYFDDEDVLNLLIEKIDEATFLKDMKIWVDGFNGFTQQEYVVLQKLMEKAPYMTIALTYDPNRNTPDRDLFNSTEKTFNKLNEMALEAGVKVEKLQIAHGHMGHKNENKADSVQRETAKTDKEKPNQWYIQYAASQLFAYPYKALSEKQEGVRLLACQTRHSEIEKVGREIINLAREKGYTWRDIAVVTPDIRDYSMHIKRTFASMNIPYFLDEKRSVMNSPLVQYILGLLKFFAYGYRYEDAFRVLKTGLSGIDTESTQILENYALAYGIKRGAWWRPFTKGKEEEVEVAEAIRIQWMDQLEPLKKKILKAKTIKEISEQVYKHMERTDLHERLSDFTATLFEKGLLDQANESAQVWNATLEILDQLVELIGEDEISLKDYIKLLETGFASTEIGIIPPAKDRVLVGNLDRSRSHDIKALFVVGVNDGKLPGVGDTGGILSDADKVFLKDAGMKFKSDYETLSEEEQLSVYQSLAKPTDKLILSYAMSDNEGKGLRPSVYIERLKKIFPDLKLESDIMTHIRADMDKVSTPESTLQALIEAKRVLKDTDKSDPFWNTVEDWYQSSQTYKDRYDMVEVGYDHKNQIDSIGKSLAGKLYGTPLRSSVSRFEKYVQCPFAHFVSYGLKPEERKLYQIELPDLGTIYHESVEKFSYMLDQEKLNWKDLTRQDSDRIIDQIIDDVAASYGHNIFESTKRYEYLIKRIKRVGRRAAWTITDQIKSGQFSPSAYELAFREGGGPDSVPPILLELPNGDTIFLEGRIDRIDVYSDGEEKYVKIVDYKSGSRKFHLSDVFYGLQIQLVVYLDAVIQNAHYLKADALIPSGMFYFKIDDPMVEADTYNPEDIEAQIRQALRMDGLTVKDVSVIKAMDESLEPGSKSEVVPVELKKDGDISSRSSAVEAEDFRLLIEHVRALMSQIGQEIVGGKVKIEPCRYSGMTSCDYCPYKGICQFDQLFENNRYRYMKKKKDDEVLEDIRKGFSDKDINSKPLSEKKTEEKTENKKSSDKESTNKESSDREGKDNA